MSVDFSGRRLVIFDFDGTLADTKRGIISTATKVLREHGVSEDQLDPANVGRIIGPPYPDAFELVFGLSREEAESVTHDYRAIYHQLGLEAWPLFPGMGDLLCRLKDAGRLMAVASSKSHKLVMQSLKDNGVDELFDFVSGVMDEATKGKDVAILRALHALDVAAEDAVMVGDRFYDVEAARSVGVDCVGVRLSDTSEPGELERAGAALVAESVEDLERVLLS